MTTAIDPLPALCYRFRMPHPEFRSEVVIRESHLDTFGHVNNASYFQIFEDARWDIVTAGGYGLKRVQELGKGPVLLDAQIRFLQELLLRERVVVRTICEPFQGKTARIRQEMIKGNGSVACEVTFTFGFFDLRTRRLIPPTEEWLKATGLA